MAAMDAYGPMKSHENQTQKICCNKKTLDARIFTENYSMGTAHSRYKGTTDESPKPHLSGSSSRFVNAQVNQILSGLWVSWKFGSGGYGRSKTHPRAILIHQELTQNILVPQFHILMGGLCSATAILRGAGSLTRDSTSLVSLLTAKPKTNPACLHSLHQYFPARK